MKEEKIIYFEDYREEENTKLLLEAVKDYCERNGIKDVVIASTRGLTARLAAQIFSATQYNVVIVTHECWFRDVKQEFDEKLREELKSKGYKFVTAAHAMGGVDRAVRNKLGGYTPGDLIATTLRMFGEGMKVAVEIACMAADAGAISIDKEVVSVAGTGRGADTAVVLEPKPSKRIFDTKIKKILAKPLY